MDRIPIRSGEGVVAPLSEGEPGTGTAAAVSPSEVSVARPAPCTRVARTRVAWLTVGLAAATAVAAVALSRAVLPGAQRTVAAPVCVVAGALAVVAAVVLVRSVRAMGSELEARSRQLECVLSLSRLARSPGVTPEEVYRGAVELAPRVLRRPGSAGARLRIGARVWVTDGFESGRWRLEAPVVAGGQTVGKLVVHLAGAVRPTGGDPFARNERALLEAVADRVGVAVDREGLESGALRHCAVGGGREAAGAG